MVLPLQDPVYERISFGETNPKSSANLAEKLLSPQEPVYESVADVVARSKYFSPKDDKREEEPVYEAVYETLDCEDILYLSPQVQEIAYPHVREIMYPQVQQVHSCQHVDGNTYLTAQECRTAKDSSRLGPGQDMNSHSSQVQEDDSYSTPFLASQKHIFSQEDAYSIANSGENASSPTQTEGDLYSTPKKQLNENPPPHDELTSLLSELSLLASPPQKNQQPNLDSMLGSLQSTMSKQGVATVTKGTCAGCNKPIIGQVGLPSSLNYFIFCLFVI